MTPVAFVTKTLPRGLLLPQFEPRCCASEDIGILWTFGFANISQLARCESNLWLGLVEGIKVGVQCILQGSHISAGVQRVPRLEAALALARFEHHHQGVQAMNDLVKWTTSERVCRRYVSIVEEVHKLPGIILWNLDQHLWVDGIRRKRERERERDGRAYDGVIELVFSSTVDRVVETIPVTYQAEAFIGVVPDRPFEAPLGIVVISVLAHGPLWDSPTPELDVDMFPVRSILCSLICRERDWTPIEVLA